MTSWRRENDRQGWFRPHFGNKDDNWTDKRFPTRLPHAPSGLDGSNRRNSDEFSNLIIANPFILDLHLSYSAGLEHGPIIEREGDTSPVMEDPEIPGSYTTDTDLQRIGAYYITNEKKRLHIREVFYCFAGNYIFHWLIDASEALKNAKEILLDHFSNLTKLDVFLDTQRLGTPALAGDVVSFIEPFKEFLSDNNIHIHNLFEQIIDHQEHEHEVIETINKIYKTTYPRPIDNFTIYKDARSFRDTITYNTRKYLRLLVLLVKNPSHEQKAIEKDLGNIALMQGCGDLTMNEWNVAFVSGKSLNDDSQGNRKWDLLYPPREPLNDRSYTCLLKWSCSKDDPELLRIAQKQIRIVYPYQIARVKFMVPSLEVGPANRHVFIEDEPIGHLLEFAIYGQQLFKDNKPVSLQSVIREFGDIRHVYKLPNLNKDESYEAETKDARIEEYSEKPRNLFNQITRDDVWLGETVLKKDRNLRVAGLKQAIQLDIKELGAPKEWVQIVLDREQTKYCTYNHTKFEVTLEGQWRWITEGRDRLLEIFLLRNQYPASMIGIRAEDEARLGEQDGGRVVDTQEIFFLAHGHNYDWQSCTIDEAAEYLSQQGAWNILLFDEGNDVFQLASETDNGNLIAKVPLKRNQLRCVFWATAKT